jgi:MFS family permease
MDLKYKVAIVTVFALFVDLLDLTTVNLAIPTLRTEFAASIGLAQLAVTAYVVMVAIVMPASGWAADRYGAKRTFLFSLAVFTFGSALCSAAWSMPTLIAARALQGIGGGLLVPVGMAILFRAFPEEERATASAIFSVPAAVAPALGPFLGGILIDAASWRWIFLINVPIGILGIPRILDLMDKHDIKLSSFVIGQAIEKAPEVAREIVRRGHEMAAHGRTWENSYTMQPDEERRFIADCVASIKTITGAKPVGWNAYWLRNSPNTLDILQDLGFQYHIDEPSRDEPFIVPLSGGDFVTVPYTFHMNDISSFRSRAMIRSRMSRR